MLYHYHATLTSYGKRLKVLLIGTLFCFFSAVPWAYAGNAATGLIQVPVRWCAVEGSPAVTNPGGVGEPDTDNVLWRRHERASDRIWIPGANITFRSGVTGDVVGPAANYPIIADPNPPADGGPGQLGDIFLDPQTESEEMKLAKAACETAWNKMAEGTTLVGPIAINARRLVDNNGNPFTNILGQGFYFFPIPPTLEQLCRNPALPVTYNGALYLTDKSFMGNDDQDARLVAHELGHVLFLGHGNGLDDDSNGIYDLDCDPSETINDPFNIMNPDTSNATRITPLQRGTSRTISQKFGGTKIDPPGSLIDGEVVGYQSVDPAKDVNDESIDMTSVTISENIPKQRTVFSHELFGIIPSTTSQYLVFADLDKNPATGGEPSVLGFDTSFQGAELVTLVEVNNRKAIPTVWQFQEGNFVKVTNRGIRASVSTTREVETKVPFFDIVSIQMPNAVRGPASQRIRIQAIAKTSKELDRLPDEPLDGSTEIVLIPPTFPVCSVTPPSVRPGDIATVEATGLRPNQTAKLFLGDDMVGNPPISIDGDGNVKTDFTVPSNTRGGSRLVTVGVMGTAITADCSVNVASDGYEDLKQ